jgi:tryptophanase
VYTTRQLEQAADAVTAILADAGSQRGFELVAEAPVLRHFTARFRPLDARLAQLVPA